MSGNNISSDQRSTRRFIPSGSSPFDLLDEDLWRYILSRLPVIDLLVPQQASTSWRRTISSCEALQRLYDDVNEDSPETWLVLNSSAQSVPLFRIRTTDGDYVMRQWTYDLPSTDAFLSENPDWFLRATAKGLMLFSSSRGGRLMLVHPLSNRFELLPEVPLRWTGRSRHMRVFMSADPTQNTYQVIILGETKRCRVYALHYRSVTRTWDTAEVNGGDWFDQYGLTCETFDGQMIWCHNKYYLSLQRYDVENKSVATCRDTVLQPAHGRAWKPCLGLFIYEGRVLILDGISHGTRRTFNSLSIWEANINEAGGWEVFMTVDLDNARMTINSNAVAAYDGEHSVSVLPRSGTNMMVIDLEQRREIVLPYNPITLNENENRDLYNTNRQNNGLKAFYMKFVFATRNMVVPQ